MKHILKVPEKDLIFLHKKMSQAKINQQIALFHGNEKEHDLPASERPTPQYIITVSSVFTVGHTFAEVTVIAFLEPDYRAAVMAQAYARHCRQGNKNKQLYSWLFLAGNNTIEDRICKVNKLRGAIEDGVQQKKPLLEHQGMSMGEREEDDDLYAA